MYVPRKLTDHLKRDRGLLMLFVHTPKCGGSFVNNAFGRRFRTCISLSEPTLAGHLTWREYRDGLAALGHDINDYVTFTVIRNPWAWHVSWYNYIRKDRGGRRSGFPEEHALFQKMSFTDYVRWLDDPTPTSHDQRGYLMQIQDWLINDDGDLAISEILRQERLRDDLVALRDKYGLRLAIPRRRKNTSFSGDYRTQFTDETAEIIARRHADDIAWFQYSFDLRPNPDASAQGHQADNETEHTDVQN